MNDGITVLISMVHYLRIRLFGRLCIKPALWPTLTLFLYQPPFPKNAFEYTLKFVSTLPSGESRLNWLLKTYPLPELYKTIYWLNSSRRSVLKQFGRYYACSSLNHWGRVITLETSGFCTVSKHILINFVKIAEKKPIFGLCSYCYSR